MEKRTLTPEQIKGLELIKDFKNSAQWCLDRVNETLAKYPKGTELHVVVLNVAKTIGLEDDGLHLKLNSNIEPVAYEFGICKQIKKAFKGKDGLGREIQTSEIKLRNVRNYLNEQRIELQAQVTKWQEKINEFEN